MTRLRAMLLLPVLLLAVCARSAAQSEYLDIYSQGGVRYSQGLTTFTNDVVVTNKLFGAVLTGDSVSVNRFTGEVFAEGNVRIQQADQVWVGDRICYNFTNNLLVAEHFRIGKYPLFAAAAGLTGDITNALYTATNAFITTEDLSTPAFGIRARHIRIFPDQRIEATHATLYLGKVPVFYFPYYSSLDMNKLDLKPGYRSAYGYYIMGTYNWKLNEQFDTSLHLDYREKRGVGVGPDLNYQLGRWGEGEIRYYYTHDRDPETNDTINPQFTPLEENRQRVHFTYLAAPATNLELRSVVRYQNDFGVIHDFFPGEYRNNPQPNTYFEINKSWRNFSLDLLAQPRINDFYETVERLPEARLAAFRQQLGPLPAFYESESSAGWYRRLYPETNSPAPPDDYWAARADSFHQITAPVTLFGWLNFIPRAGGRFTYYGDVGGLDGSTNTLVRTNTDTYRGVFNTGAELTFKASRLWPGTRSQLLDVDGMRHIIQPSANYVFVPEPNHRPQDLPQFDRELPSLRLLPAEFPEYNAIDSIDSQEVIRFGLANKLQTRRDGQLDDLLRWEVFADWRLRPGTTVILTNGVSEELRQERFSDIYSDLALKPRSWMTLLSQLRIDPNESDLRMSLHSLSLEPNNVWNWTVGHFYLRDDFSDWPTALGEGNNLILSSLYYRLNENWGVRASHHYDVRSSQLQEQDYTIYRDLRSWTVALKGTVRENSDGHTDWSINFTFSLKAKPRYGLGSDTIHHRSLLGD